MALKEFDRPTYEGYSAIDSRDENDWQDTLIVQTKCVSIIIPTLNEVDNIAQLLFRIDQTMKDAGYFYEVLVIDDHSTDNTVEIAQRTKTRYRLPLRTMTKQGRNGKSFSLMEGFNAARYDILAMIDGDLQYPPESLPDMLHALSQQDVVVADRRTSYIGANRSRGQLSNSFDAIFGKMLFGLDTDLQSGLKVFRRHVYQSVSLKPSKWSFDLEFLAKVKHKGYRIGNVAIIYEERHGGKSKVRPATVGIELVSASLRLKLSLTLQTIGFLLMRTGIIPQSEHFVATQQLLRDEYDAFEMDEVEHREHNYYARWLVEEEELHRRDEHEQIAADYAQRALQSFTFHGKEVRTFTPLPRERSALQSFMPAQIVTIVTVMLIWCFSLFLMPIATVVATLSIIMVVYVKNMIDTFRMIAQSLDHNQEEHIDDSIINNLDNDHWPRYTILCPLYKEAEIVPQFVTAMSALDYPATQLQILFLTEENDNATRDAILNLNLPSHFQIITVPDGEPRTKPRACNYGLLQATGDYIVIYDAEDIPDPLQIKKAVLTFANHTPDLACVQAKLNFYNPEQNLLTRWFTIEYSLWFDLILPGMQKAKMSLPLGGTSNHFRTSILRKLGAWDPFNVTEDCDLGLRLAQHHLHTVVLDSTTMEEANSQGRNWIRQRSRWIKGYLQTYLVHMRQPFRYFKTGRFREFLSLQFIIGGTPATFFINPIMWFMVAIYIGLRPFVEATYKEIYPAPLFYAGMLCLVFGNFMYIYTSLLACAKRGQYGLMLWSLTLPLYWMMMSIAAVMAFFQLLFKPHYWEKTQHGLHLKSQQHVSPVTDVPANSRIDVSMLEVSGIHPTHWE